jgi:S1-C subfamily serine protease
MNLMFLKTDRSLQQKRFGIYKDKTGDVPVGFTATNHTTGGNSGSPALDANGNLVGLNFRQTMGRNDE